MAKKIIDIDGNVIIPDVVTKLRMVKGTVVLNTSGQSGNGFQFMSLNAIRTLFNDTSISHLMVHCIVSNGDSLANQCHVVGTSWTNGDILSVTLDAPTDGAFRVNYLMFVIKE